MKLSRFECQSITFRAFILFLISAVLLATQTTTFAQQKGQLDPEDLPTISPPPTPPKLDTVLLQAGPKDLIPVVVAYARPINNAEYNDLKLQAGLIQNEYQYKKVLYGMSGSLTADQIKVLSALPFVKSVEYDAPVYAFLDGATKWFGVQDARTDFRVTGRGIGIAILDTGIDPKHLDLDGDKIKGWKDFVNEQASPYDDNDMGHGTHVASIAAGTGEGNPKYTGVAPEASLIGVKVLDRNGIGSESNVIKGIEWCIENRDIHNIHIINLSLGKAGSSDGKDLLSTAVNNAVDAGLIVCVASGVTGPAKYTIGSPAAAEKAITVSAMADIDEKGFYLANFSSRGPTADERIKPDVCAPGIKITAAKRGTINEYIAYSGTSMASPFVAGIVALILEKSPNLTPLEIKGRIKSKAIDWGVNGTDTDIDYGAGRLDGYTTVGDTTISKPIVPTHRKIVDGHLPSTGASDWFDIDVSDISSKLFPIAVTLIMPNWKSFNDPDFDIFFYPPGENNRPIAISIGMNRQEEIGFQPTVIGTWKLEVYSFFGSGSYLIDISQPPSSPHPSLSVEPRSREVSLNSTFSINIVTKAAIDIAGFQFDLKFDPDVLEASNVEEGDFLKGFGGKTSFIRPKLDNSKGLISGIVNVRMSPKGVDGDGTLVKAKFIARKKGNSTITFHNVKFSDSSAKEIRNRLEIGEISVTASFPWDIDQNKVVNVFDLVIVGQSFEKKRGEKDFDPRADVNRDGRVDIFDFVLVAKHFGEITTDDVLAAPVMALENLSPEQIVVLEKLYQILDRMPNSDPEFLRIKEMLRELIRLAPNQITHSRVLQNYPNPFNPETWIPFELAAEAKVTITIYNALGQLVRTIDLGEKLRGSYVSKEAAAYWDGRNEFGESVAGGVYFYRIQAGKFSAIKKMILIK